MRTVELASGVSFAADWCGAAEGALTAQLLETMPSEVALAFLTPGAADRIVFHAGSDLHDVFEGYTQLYQIITGWEPGTVRITLKKGDS